MGEAVDDATALCLACGICCEGVLHNHALADSEELDDIEQLGISLFEKQDYPAFALPCPCHIDRQCTVYDRRPKACGAYKCTLLREAQRGARTFGEAQRIVGQVREVMERIYGVIGRRDPGVRIWNQARAFLAERHEAATSDDDFRRQNATLLLDINVLALLCGRHFEPKNFRGAWRWEDVDSGQDSGPTSALAALH